MNDFQETATRMRETLAPERMEDGTIQEFGTSEQLGLLYGAVATASAGFGEVEKTASVSFNAVSFKYAPLSNLTRAVRGALSKEGLSFLQPLSMQSGQGCVRTILGHKGGGRLVSCLYFQAEKDLKKFGSQSTYYRRYSLCALLGLDGVDDADSHEEPTSSGSQYDKPKARRQPAPTQSSTTVRERPEPDSVVEVQKLSETQNSSIKALIKELGIKRGHIKAICEEASGALPSDLNGVSGQAFIAYLSADDAAEKIAQLVGA